MSTQREISKGRNGCTSSSLDTVRTNATLAKWLQEKDGSVKVQGRGDLKASNERALSGRQNCRREHKKNQVGIPSPGDKKKKRVVGSRLQKQKEHNRARQ